MHFKGLRHRRLVALLASTAFHLLVVVPYGIHGLVARPQVQPKPNEDVEVAYLDDIPAEDAAPAPEPPAPERPPEPAQKPEPPKPEPEQQKPPEPAELAKKPPRPEPKVLQVIPNAHLKMVDQDQFPDEADNADARFLAQKNHRAKEDTRAQDSNLVRAQQGERQSSESERQQGDPGDKDRRIAELQDQAGQARPTGAPSPGAPAAAEPQPPRPTAPLSPLAKADPGSAQREPQEGLVVPPESGPGMVVQSGQEPLAKPRTGTQAQLNLSHRDHDAIVGYDIAEAQRRAAARAERSHTPGRWDRLQQKLGVMRSSLENFTPSVRPGNQSELGTRAHPFAAFLAAVHRQIHVYWGFGFLANLNRRTGTLYDDPNLVTALELSLNPDGTLHRLVIARPSGVLGYDMAAMDAVLSAAPFPSPPEAIKSKDGQVYVTWMFHRDDRQCATDFVEPHILTSPGPPPKANVPALSPQAQKVRPQNLENLNLQDIPQERSRKEPAALARKAPPAAPPTAPATATPGAPASAASAVPAEAQQVAQKWLAALNRADVKWLAGYSALPFQAGGSEAETKEDLVALYEQLLGDLPRGFSGLSFFTAAELRKKLGRLPPGISAGEEQDMAFARARAAGVDLTLYLQAADKGWRVVGLSR